MSNSPQTKSSDSNPPTPENVPTTPATNNATTKNSPTSPAETSVATTQSTPVPKATTPAMTQTPVTSPMTETKSEKSPEVQFTTDKIGQWKSAQENPFAAQNRKDATKKAKREATVRKVFPISLWVGLGVLSVALIACIIGLVITIVSPKPLDELTFDENVSMQEAAQKIFEKHTQGIDMNKEDGLTEAEKKKVQDAISAVNKYYDTQLERAQNDETVAEIIMSKMFMLLSNQQYQDVIDTAKQININSLDSNSRAMFYNYISGAYYGLGNTEESDKYFQMMINEYGGSYVAG